MQAVGAATDAVTAEHTSKPLRPAKPMTPEQRRTQLDRDRLLREQFPHLKSSQRTLDDRARGRLDAVIESGGRSAKTRSAGAKGASPMVRADTLPELSRKRSSGDAAAAEAPTVVRHDFPPPANPRLSMLARPGQTVWGVSFDWSGGTPQGQFYGPMFLQLDLYRAFDNKLIATRNYDTDDLGLTGGDTSGFCVQWIIKNVSKQCGFTVYDGVLLTQPAKAYYAKVSWTTAVTYSCEQVEGEPEGTCQYIYRPHEWGSKTTSPSGAAWTTPGVPGSMAGNCTCSYQVRVADPVNTATGAVVESVTDATVPGKGLPLSVDRHYASDATDTTTLLGKGWRLGFESELAIAADEVTLTDADGAKVTFAKEADGTYSAPTPVRYTLSPVGGGGFTVTSLDQTRRTFDADGRLTGWTDSTGKGLSLEYTSGKLTGMTDASGRRSSLRVDATTGLLASITLADGREVSYTYTTGQLASVTGVDGGVTKYTYVSGRLATVVDPNGKTVTRNTYDADTGRISRQVDALGGTFGFSWEPDPDLPAGSGEARMTDPAGGIWSDVYQAGVLMRSYRPEGSSSDRVYDTDLNTRTETDGRNIPTAGTFDDRGNLTARTRGGVTQKFTFDTVDRLETVTDGRGATTTIEYDETSGLPKKTTGPAGGSSFTYTDDGQLETATSPGGGVTRYDYTDHGLLASVTRPEGGKTTYTYDGVGQLKTKTDPRGNTEGADATAYTTVYAYDDQGRLKTVTDPKGNATAYTYDDNGNVKTVTDAKQGVTAYEYNAANQVTKVTDPAGKFRTKSYDSRGNLTEEVDETGRKTTYRYDGAGRRASMTSPRGNVPGAEPAEFTTTYGYDDNGNLTETVGPDGGLTTTDYDDLNRPVEVTDPMGRVTLTEYDANDNVTKVTNPLGKATTYTYTPADRVETVTNPLGKVHTYGYDADGNQILSRTPLGRKTTWTYDLDGRMTTSVDPRGYYTGYDPARYTTHYRYDAAGNPTTVTDPLGNVTTTEYDTLGRVSARIDAEEHAIRYGYDELGRPTKVTAADGGVTGYGYDAAGNVKTRTDANQHTTTYGYDAAHRLTSVTDPLDHTITYGYDQDGNRNSTTNARGAVATTTFNANNWPTEVDYSDATPDVTYTYYGDGSRKTITDATGTRDLTYFADGQLKTVSKQGQSTGFTYGYDDAGRLTSRAYPDGRETTYTYNNDGLRDSSTTDGATTAYAYDYAGALLRTTLPDANGHQEQRAYDRAGRLTKVSTAKDTAVLSSWTATLDPVGRPTRVDSARGATAASEYFTYDHSGRLLTECTSPTKADVCPAGAPTATYTYDKVGNRKTETSGTSAVNFTYDEADRLTSRVSGSSTIAVKSDPDGNLTEYGAWSYTYDAENNLTSATNSTPTTSKYVYDADGLRTKATQPDGTQIRDVTWDLNYDDGLPRVASEHNAGGYRIADYRYNPEGQIEAETTAAGAFYHHHDTLGSVTDITSATGALQIKYDYTAFGNLTTTNVGTDLGSNRFTFTGEYKEPTTGIAGYYLRARDYNPAMGRFLSPDPIRMRLTEPYESTYTYAGNAPTWLTDPSGKSPCPPGSLPVSGSICTHSGPLSSEADESAKELGVEWVSGWGSADRYYGPGSVLVEELRRDHSMETVRFRIGLQISQGITRGKTSYSVFSEGYGRIAQDLLTTTGLLQPNNPAYGSDTAAFIGSYTVNWQRNGRTGSAYGAAVPVDLSVVNETDLTSLTHLPGPLQGFLETCVGGPLDWFANLGGQGPFRRITQHLNWSEWIYPAA